MNGRKVFEMGYEDGTVVYVDDKIIEKPNSMDEARNNIYLCIIIFGIRPWKEA